MAKYNLSNFKYTLQSDSVSKLCREVHVTFTMNGGTYRTFVFVPKKIPNASDAYYIREAKKDVEAQIKSGKLIKNAKRLDKKHPGLLRNILIGTACAALIAGTAVGSWYYFQNNQPGPEPQPEPVIHTFNVVESFGNQDGDTSSYIFRGPLKVEEGKTYECSVELKAEFKGTHEINNLHITMNGTVLKMNEDYTFTPDGTTAGKYNIRITKAVDGNIVIHGSIQFNSFNVYCSHVGCTWTNKDGSDAIETAPKNGQYICYINPEDGKEDDYDANVYGVAINKSQLKLDQDYTYNAESGELIINKVTGTVHIVAGLVEKVATQVPVYHSEFNCKVEAPKYADIGSEENYVATITANNPTNQTPNIVSVTFNGVSATKGVDYTFAPSTNNDWKLSITNTSITAELNEIYFSVVAVDNPQTTVDVAFDGGEFCQFTGSTTAELEGEYTCKITPTAGHETYKVRIVSVVMNGAVLKPTLDYTFDGTNFKITNVTGNINIVAIAQEVTSAKHAVAVITDAGLEVTNNAPTVDAGSTYSCNITPKDDLHWGRIALVTMNGMKLDMSDEANKGYTYDRDGGTGLLTIKKPADGDIVIYAVSEEKAKSTFQVEDICFESSFTGESTFTPGTATSDYTATITADDPTTKAPKILKLTIGGVDVTDNSSYYTLTPPQEGNNYTLKVFKEKVTGDIFVAVSVEEKTRSTYNVTIYNYNCVISDAADHVNLNSTYTATIKSASTDSEPYVFSVTMGSTKLNSEGAEPDYTFNIKTGALTINKPATGDIVICATVRTLSTYSGIPEFDTTTPGKAIVKKINVPESATYGITEVTDVVIPNEVNVSNDEVIPVAEINPGILNGFKSIERLTIPFIGTKLTYEDSDSPYSKLFGQIFGSKLFDGCSALTWQSFYMNENENEDSYKITKAAIPTSLAKVTVNGGAVNQGAFSQCRNINVIELNNITSNTIGAYAFNGCKSLHTIDINAATETAINTIEWRAFAGCSTLESYKLTSVNTIKHHAFSDCTGITQLILPYGLVNVGSSAFSGINTGVIASVKTRSEVDDKIRGGTWASDWVGDTAQVVYGFSNDKMYMSDDDNWRFLITRKDGTSDQYGATIIEYLGSDIAETITIPTSFEVDSTTYMVTEIGAGVFYEYSRLQIVDFQFATGLQFIGNYAFMNCKSLTTLNGLKNTPLISVGNYAFNRCEKLVIADTASEHLFPNTVKEFGVRAFGSCPSLKSIYLTHCTSLDSIGDRLFYECGDDSDASNIKGLETIALPTVLYNVGSEVFTKCYALSDLTITVDDVDTIPDSICEDCAGLTTFTWKYASGSTTHLVNIGAKAFKGCTKLATTKLDQTSSFTKSNAISKYVMSIGTEAFANCTDMRSFSLEKAENLTRKRDFSIGQNVFTNWGSTNPDSEVQTLWAYLNTDDDNWGTYHDTITGTVYTSFGWILAWGENASIYFPLVSEDNYYWRSGNVGSNTLYIRDWNHPDHPSV